MKQNPQRRVLRWTLVPLAQACMLSLIACGDRTPPAPPPPPVVEIAMPEVREVTEYFYYTGSLQAVEEALVRARVSGILERVTFSESTNVEAGDLLFVIEKAPYEIAVGRAEAALARTKASRDLAEARLRRTQEAFDAAAANEIELIEAKAELAQAEADVLAADREVDAAKLDLSYTDVVSPISGRVDRNYVDEGNLVGRTDATELARVVRLDALHVQFDVSERIALRYLSRGKDGRVDDEAPYVEVGLADEEGYPHPGRVDFVDSLLDQSTGTLTVRALLQNTTQKLYPGLFARIRVPWETQPGAVVVREEAVGTGLDGKYLMVVAADGTVERRPVTLGERQQDGFVVVAEGIAGDETYIVQGLQKARPGAKVSPKPFGEPPGGVEHGARSPAADATPAGEG